VPTREELPDGSIRLEADDVSFHLSRIRPDALLIVIEGYDQGQLGAKPLDEIGAALGRGEPMELFVDASQVTGVTTAVREEWTRWFVANQARLRRVHVLVSGRFMNAAVSVAQHLARVGELIQITGDAARFASKLRA